MAFLEMAELKSAIYTYQVEEITEADDDIVLMAIASGLEEVKSYLRPSNKKKFQDGRPLYDVNLAFAAVGPARNALVLEVTKTLSVWWLCRLCNVDMIYDNVKERYDRAITWLTKVNAGETVLDLPLLPNTEEGTPADKKPFRFGSREKFNHE